MMETLVSSSKSRESQNIYIDWCNRWIVSYLTNWETRLDQVYAPDPPQMIMMISQVSCFHVKSQPRLNSIAPGEGTCNLG